MHGIRLAHQFLSQGGLPLLDRMTNDTERFPETKLREAVERAADADSLKVIVHWD